MAPAISTVAVSVVRHAHPPGSTRRSATLGKVRDERRPREMAMKLPSREPHAIEGFPPRSPRLTLSPPSSGSRSWGDAQDCAWRYAPCRSPHRTSERDACSHRRASGRRESTQKHDPRKKPGARALTPAAPPPSLTPGRSKVLPGHDESEKNFSRRTRRRGRPSSRARRTSFVPCSPPTRPPRARPRFARCARRSPI